MGGFKIVSGKTKQIGVSLDQKTYDIIQRLAIKNNANNPNIVRQMIDYCIGQLDKEELESLREIQIPNEENGTKEESEAKTSNFVVQSESAQAGKPAPIKLEDVKTATESALDEFRERMKNRNAGA